MPGNTCRIVTSWHISVKLPHRLALCPPTTWKRYKAEAPTRCKTGRRHMDLPRGLRPQCITIDGDEVVEVVEGPEVDCDEPCRR